MSAAGSLLFTADGSSLSIYNIVAGQDTPVTAQVTIPAGNSVSIVPGSFSEDPTATTANPDGSQTLEWNLDLSSASSSQTITWQSNVTGLEPNQSVTVADDATVQFVNTTENLQSVSIDAEVNGNLQNYYQGNNYPSGGTQIEVGGVPFTLADYSGGGTGVVQTQAGLQASPSVFDIPVSIANPSVVYTLINSAYGVLNNLDGEVEFIGTGGADAVFYLVEGVNIRDHFNGSYNNQIAAGTPTIEYGPGPDRLDRQTFVLPSSFAGQTLTDIRLSGFGDDPSGEPFLAAATVAVVPSGAASSTLNLPDQIVTGIGFIGISPSTQTVAPAETAGYDVTLANPTSSAVTYTLSVQGVPAGWASLAPSVTVGANQSTDVPLVLTPAASATGSYAFNVSATAADGRSASVGASLLVQGQPINSPDSLGVVLIAHLVTSHRRRRYGRAILAPGHQCRQRRRHIFASALGFAAGRHRRAQPVLDRRTAGRQQLP